MASSKCKRVAKEKKTKAALAEDVKKDKEILKLQFGEKRFLTYSSFMDTDKIHIREYYSLNGKSYPSKRGICLSASRFSTLYNTLPEIIASVELLLQKKPVKMNAHIGGGVYATVSSDYQCVDIRRFWKPEGETKECATRNGLAIRLDEFEKFVGALNELATSYPHLISLSIICAYQLDHCNQIVAIDCKECNPFGLSGFDI